MHHHNMLDLAPAACVASEAILAPLRGRAMHDRGRELPRILLPRTRVNKPYRVRYAS
jgi:hypothetical protein